MQLTSKDGSMVVDFYPVKFADGTMHNRLVLKVVTFCNDTQSKRYINKKDVANEINSRMEGYGYEMTRLNTIPQLFNSGLACSCQFMSLIKQYLHNKMMTSEQLDTLKNNYAYHIVDGMDMNDLITFAVETVAHNMEMWDEEDVKSEIIDLYGDETLSELLEAK